MDRYIVTNGYGNKISITSKESTLCVFAEYFQLYIRYEMDRIFVNNRGTIRVLVDIIISSSDYRICKRNYREESFI